MHTSRVRRTATALLLPTLLAGGIGVAAAFDSISRAMAPSHAVSPLRPGIAEDMGSGGVTPPPNNTVWEGDSPAPPSSAAASPSGN